ncbi:MAG: peptidylprolyl isomerase [Formivibrio sp.]|nr:peptidylprolyl isomerase [Formivibrio sp.]
MFDLVQKNKTAVQIVLGMVSFGLVVGFGLSGYSAFQQGENFLAKVGGVTITERDLAEAVSNQTVPDEMKPAVVEQLVQQKLLAEEAHALRLSIADATLRTVISTIPAFQVDGKFDSKRYMEVLDQQRMTPESFEQKLKQDLISRQLVGGISTGSFTSAAMQDRMEKLLGERREVQVSLIPATDFVKQVAVSADEIKQYYTMHSAEFKMPELVKLEYLTLSQTALAAKQDVSEAEIQKYFDEHKQDITKEERKARHILLALPKGATPAQKAELKKQAEALLVEVKKNGANFAEIAKRNSQDPGSAAQGGDLGWFSHGMMVKAFDDAVFALNKGQISNVVESEFGFHIIKLDDVRTKTLNDAKPEIIQHLKEQKAQTAFQSQSEKLNEIVYQQADSLKPAADALHLEIHTSDWVGRQGGKETDLANPKIGEAVFSDDVLNKKHNSEPVEVAPGVMVVARVIEHKPEQVSPLTEASDKIAAQLRSEKAFKQAVEQGANHLKTLQAGQNVDLKWTQPQEVMRVGNQQMAEEQVKAIFRVPAEKLPGYVGGELKGQGYLVYKVVKVAPAIELAADARQQMKDTLAQMYGQVAITGFVEALRKQIKVEYKAVTPKNE